MQSGEKSKSTVEKVRNAKWINSRKKSKCTVGKKKTAVIRFEKTNAELTKL